MISRTDSCNMLIYSQSKAITNVQIFSCFEIIYQRVFINHYNITITYVMCVIYTTAGTWHFLVFFLLNIAYLFRNQQSENLELSTKNTNNLHTFLFYCTPKRRMCESTRNYCRPQIDKAKLYNCLKKKFITDLFKPVLHCGDRLNNSFLNQFFIILCR